MSTLIKGTKLTGDILLEKQLGTTLTLNTNQKYVDSDVEFNISVQSGVSAANTATADANIQAGGTGNISASIGSKSSSQPASGYYIKVQAEGSGSSKITTPGWVEAGALSAASTTSTKYFPIDAATVTLGEPTVDSTGLVTVTATKTAGYTPAGTETATVQLTPLGATTYPAAVSNREITSGKYITGTQTILGVSTSGISAENIRKGATVKVGDTADDSRITSVPGSFTDASTVSAGQTAASSSQIISGYSAWVNGSEVKGNIVPKSSSDITVDENVVTIPAGVYSTENTATIGAGAVTSGSAIISTITHEYNETSGKFDVGGTGTIGAPTVGTAGYVSSTKGTKNTNTATVSTTEDEIVGTVNFSGASTRKPSISKQATPTGVTNAASGDATTTAPSSGVYVAVKTTANTGTLTATPAVTAEGYGTATNNGLAPNTQTVGALASDTTYVPITTTSASVDGDTVSYGSGWITAGSKKVDAGTVVASVSANNSGSASIAATGFTPLSSGTSSYYVTLSTAAGSVKAKAAGGNAGYVTSSTTNETNDVTVSVSGNGNKIYIPAGSTTANAPTVNSSGLVTATTTVIAGYQPASTPSNTLQLSTQGAKTVTPTESAQTAVASGKYTTGAVTVAAIPSTYVGSDIAQNDSDDLTVSGATVTAPAGYYATDASATVASGSVTMGTITVSSTGLVTAPATVTAGYVSAATPSKTLQLTTKAAATITPGTSNQTIASGTYLTGTQTIAGDADLVAGNIKKGVNIFGVDGTFTTTPSGKNALTAAALRTGYAGFINGSQVNGSMADSAATEGTTTVSGTTATRGTWSQTSGYTDARTISAATFANTATANTTYVDISSTTDAPVLVSGGHLYINKGYTDNLKISLAKLVPDGASANLVSDVILSGYSAYNNDGVLVAGNIPTKVDSNISVSGKTVTVPAGYYAQQYTKSIADAVYSADSSASSNSTVTPSLGLDSTATTTYGFTTTAPSSGTSGTNFLTLDPGASATAWSVTPRANITTAGYIAKESKNGTAVSQTPSIAAGTNYYVPVVSASFGGGGLSTSSDTNTVTAPTVTIASSGTFKTTTGYGVTTTKPSGTDGTNYLTIDGTGTLANGKATSSWSVSKAATTYTNSAGVIAAHSAAQAQGTDSKSGGKETTITPTVTDNFAPLYIPIVSNSFSGGGISITTNYSKSDLAVTLTDGSDKNVANYTVGAKDTTNYPYYVKVSGSTPAVSGKTKATRAAATYSNSAGAIAAHSGTQIWDASAVEPTVSVNAASGATYVGFKSAAISGSSTNATATTTVAPGTVSVSKQATPSGVTNAASGDATTTAPTSGVYVAVKATANANSTGTTSAISGSGTATVSTAGYAPTSLTGSVTVSGTATAKTSAKDSSVTYVPITTATPTFKGGAVSGTATASASGASISTTTNNSGITISAAASATRAKVQYNAAVAGWVSKAASADAYAASSDTALTGTTYYLNGVTLTAPSGDTARTFSVTVPNGSSTATFVFNVDKNSNVTITES